MAVDSFRLEPFRPWNPFQDKAQPRQEFLEACQYPSPVSISTTSPPSNSSTSASENPNVHSYKSERHPIPPRPSMEVCLNDSQPQEVNTQHPPTVGDQTSCASLGVEASGFDDILQLQDLPSPGGEDHPSICDDLGPESQNPLDFDLGDPRLVYIASQHSHVGITGSSSLAGEWCDATIDPAILDDYRSPDVEQSPSGRKEASRAVAPLRSSDRNVRGHNMRTSLQRPKPMRQRSGISKAASVVDNRHMNKTSLTTQANDSVKMSFSVLRDHFSSLPVQERLEFLSWLFEGALSQSFNMPSRSSDTLASKDIPREEGVTTSSPNQPSVGTGIVHGKRTCSSRKGLPWSAEENRLLVQLREEESLSWSEVIKRFDQRFPGRSKSSIQVYWSTTQKKQRLS